MLEIKHLYKNYFHKGKKIEAVNDINFSILPGKIYGLLGPNGAGKTTTLRIISTILKPIKGDVFYNGKSIFDYEIEYRKKMAYVSANTGIYNKLYPYEFVKLFGEIHGLDEKTIKKRFENIVEKLKMQNILKKIGGKLSTGEKQKISIARLMITDPEILILDEPTTGLDVITSKNIIDFINEEKKRGKIIILSTHILSEAEYLCEDIGIIHQGKLLYNGTLKDIKKKYNDKSLEEIFLNLLGETIEK